MRMRFARTGLRSIASRGPTKRTLKRAATCYRRFTSVGGEVSNPLTRVALFCTWIYRVAHNVACSHVDADRRSKARQLVSIEGMDVADDKVDAASLANRRMALVRLMTLIRSLEPIDRQVVLLFLEGMDAAEIAELTGLSPGNVATKIHRIKNVLIRRFRAGGEHD